VRGPIKGILLDAGHTLVFVDRRRMAEIFRKAGYPWDRERFDQAEWVARAQLVGRVEEGHEGTEPHLWREYFLTLFRESGVPPELEEEVGALVRSEHARSHLWTHVEPGTREALDRLAEAGYRLGVVSNADGRMEDALERAGVRRQVSFVVDSGVEGVAKPDPRIFLEGARRLGLPPDGCLYVGDLYPVDVVGARRAGMDAVLVDPGGWTRRPVRKVPAIRDLPGLVSDPSTHRPGAAAGP
jgi:putative hydrolase of the HAD superfamily